MEHTWRFKKAMHEDFGESGWLLEGAPSTYVPLSGMGIAHDVLEHAVGDEGSIEEELMALGAMMLVRGEGGYWDHKRSYHPPGVHLGSDVGIYLAFRYGGLENGIKSPGRTYKLEDHVEEWIASAVHEARKNIKSEGAWGGCYSEPTKAQIRDYLKNVPGWLRVGYRKALKRYKHCTANRLTEVFEKIERDADKFLTDDLADYCSLVVSFNPQKACQLRIYLDEPEFDYDEG